ncbi:DUF930 domain-containing protein [Methylorubrum extorquens]|uniref:DUF930 domain-containing protein n=1 Tax=Methylorubrum extorquens TaxID=408 RepID=UPI002238A888|nr:DUF930 domain-containing protein [Methylorubrum extorquens]UYW27275.1 DUF930 domain-containing protein [Methylorubrum extorquens]
MDRTSLRAAGLSALFLVPSVASAGQAPEARDRLMLKLEFGTRVEQRCDARAGGEISRHHPGFEPDKVIAYALSDSRVRGTEVVADGAAVRSRGRWYRLSFRCKTTADGLGIVAFEHSLGSEIQGWDMSKLYHGD